jgi:ABC-2 type transport system permease protein
MSVLFTMVKRELKSITKEKTIILAIIIQLFIASFSSIIAIGLMSFLDPDSIGQNTRVAVKVGIVGNTSSPLTEFLRERNLKVTLFSDASSAEKAFHAGRIDTIIFVPRSNNTVVNMKLILPDLDSKATVILMVLKEPLKKYETYLREINGIQVNYKDLEGQPSGTYEFLYSLIVPMLMFFPALLAGSIVIDTVSEEIENKTLDTLRVTPVSLNDILAAKILAAIITVLIQCLMWAMLLRLNNLQIQNLGLVLLLCVIIGTFISISGAIVALYFKDRERSQFMYSMGLMVTAGLSFLLDPSPVSLVARLAAGNFHTGIFDVMLYVIPLTVFGIVCFMASKKLVSLQS